MIGLDVTHQALMTSADAESLRRTGRTGTLVAELWAFYNRFHSQTYGFDGSPIHDAVALAHVFRRISSRPSTGTSRSTAAPSSAGTDRGRPVAAHRERAECPCGRGDRKPRVHRAPTRPHREPGLGSALGASKSRERNTGTTCCGVLHEVWSRPFCWRSWSRGSAARAVRRQREPRLRTAQPPLVVDLAEADHLLEPRRRSEAGQSAGSGVHRGQRLHSRRYAAGSDQ